MVSKNYEQIDAFGYKSISPVVHCRKRALHNIKQFNRLLSKIGAAVDENLSCITIDNKLWSILADNNILPGHDVIKYKPKGNDGDGN